MKSQQRKMMYESRIAHMATSTKDGTPHVIPICYAFDGKFIYSPIDEKPKRVRGERLQRIRNIMENPRICLVVDVYSENWNNLRYLMVRGTAKVIRKGSEHRKAVALLRRKYPQYHRMQIEKGPIIRIKPARIIVWTAANLES